MRTQQGLVEHRLRHIEQAAMHLRSAEAGTKPSVYDKGNQRWIEALGKLFQEMTDANSNQPTHDGGTGGPCPPADGERQDTDDRPAPADGTGTVVAAPAQGGGELKQVAPVSGLVTAIEEAKKKQGAPRRRPTEEQQAIIDAARAGHRVVVVQAGAGTGKTSTDVMISEALGGQGQYTAFNAPLCAEARGKLPAHVEVNTIHSLAFRAEGKRFKHRLGRGRVKSEAVAKMLGIGTIEIGDKRLAPGFLAGLVLAAVRRFCNSADTEVNEGHFPYQAGLDKPDVSGGKGWENNNRVRVELLPFARKAWEDLSDVDGRLPYTHDCYCKTWELNHPVISCDYLLIDEAQDLVPRDISIVKKQKCQVIIVGDSAQTIYAWRGCEDALDQFPDAPTLYLTQSFRFGESIAAVANAVLETLEEKTELRLKGLSSIKSRVITKGPNNEQATTQGVPEPNDGQRSLAADSAREIGSGRTSQLASRETGLQGLDRSLPQTPLTILTRTNACAVGNLLNGIAEGKRPFLVGGGADVIAFMEGAKALKEGKTTSHPELACFSNWVEVEDYAKEDDGADLQLMVRLIKKFGCDAILQALKSMPPEEQADLVISTAHKSKGREWNNVQLASDFPTRSKCGDEDKKLLYVAVTRAKLVLNVSRCPFFTGEDSLRVSGETLDVTKIEGYSTEPLASALQSSRSGVAQPQGSVRGRGASVQENPPGPDLKLHEDPTKFTWKRDGEKWLIRGPKNRSAGEQVDVHKRFGPPRRERLGAFVKDDGDFSIYKPS